MMKNLALAGLLVGLSLAGSGCHRASAQEPPTAVAETMAVQVIHPQEKLGHATASATGRVRSVHEATLSARVSGPIARVLVGVGDRVKAGQALVELESTAAAGNAAATRAGRDGAAAELRIMELELDRAQKLFAEGALPRAQLDRAVASRDGARARVASLSANITMAERTLGDHVVRAPFDGVITARPANQGETVTAMPPTPLLTVMDLEQLEVRLDAPEAAVVGLAFGAPLTVTVSPSGRRVEAKVKAVAAAVDVRSRTVEVLLSLPRDERAPGEPIRPGSLVTAELAATAALTGPFLPKQAVRGGEGGSFVWVVADGVAHKRAVGVEPQGAELVRVLSGLSGKEAVVLVADERLAEGARVRAVD